MSATLVKAIPRIVAREVMQFAYVTSVCIILRAHANHEPIVNCPDLEQEKKRRGSELMSSKSRRSIRGHAGYSVAIAAFFYREVVAVSFENHFACRTSLKSDHFEEMMEE